MRRLVALLTIVGAALVAVGVPARAETGAPAAPSYPKDFPDPHVIYAGGRYVAYATGTDGLELQVMTSGDLAHWGSVSNPLPHPPLWAALGFTWAPGVVRLGGRYVMYYTARYLTTDKQCIGLATSSAPTGPFVDNSVLPFICQQPGSIDPDPVIAADGKPYVVWKSDDNSSGQRTNLWSQALSGDGLSLVGSPRRLIEGNVTYGLVPSWQRLVVEGPAMVLSGGAYYLFYGGGKWDSRGSGIGYAVCSSPLGPCSDRTMAAPWVATRAAVVGPQGPSIFRDSRGQLRLAFAAWTGPVGYANGGVRSLWLGNLSFSSGRPVLS
jgi:beta-xylosidase